VLLSVIGIVASLFTIMAAADSFVRGFLVLFGTAIVGCQSKPKINFCC